MSPLHHITGLLRCTYLGYWYKGTCPKIGNCQAFGEFFKCSMSQSSPKLLLPAGKDGLVTKGFIFNCHQLFIPAKQAPRAIFLPTLLKVLQSKNFLSTKIAQTSAQRCPHHSNANMYILFPCFTLVRVVLHRPQGKHRYNSPQVVYDVS